MTPELARAVHAFADDLKTRRSYQGVIAFLLFALVCRIRVFIWYNNICEDIVEKYASWASSYAFSATAFEEIACRTAGQGSLHTVIDLKKINHWVSCEIKRRRPW